MTPVVNVANLLTLLRFVCIPIVVVLLFAGGGSDSTMRWWAAGVFVLASLTDLFDGAVARRHGLVTTVGTIADPIADKALTGAALVSLSILGDLPWWITIVILVREVGVTSLRFIVMKQGMIPASRGGKVKTVFQVIAITMYLLQIPNLEWWPTASSVAMMIALVLTLVTGADYCVQAMRLRAGRASG